MSERDAMTVGTLRIGRLSRAVALTLVAALAFAACGDDDGALAGGAGTSDSATDDGAEEAEADAGQDDDADGDRADPEDAGTDDADDTDTDDTDTDDADDTDTDDTGTDDADDTDTDDAAVASSDLEPDTAAVTVEGQTYRFATGTEFANICEMSPDFGFGNVKMHVADGDFSGTPNLTMDLADEEPFFVMFVGQDVAYVAGSGEQIDPYVERFGVMPPPVTLEAGDGGLDGTTKVVDVLSGEVVDASVAVRCSGIEDEELNADGCPVALCGE